MSNIFGRMAVVDNVEVKEGDAYAPLRELVALSETFDADKKDIVTTMGALSAVGRSVIINGEAYGLSHRHGMAQLCVKAANLTNEDDSEVVGRLPAAWMAEKGGSHADEVEYILLSRFRRAADTTKRYLFRSYNGQLRAVLDGKYPTFGGDSGYENTTMLKAVQTTFEQLNAKESRIARCSITPDNIRARVFFKSIDANAFRNLNSFYAGKMWIGAIVSNDETGNGGFKIGPAALRHACNNSYHHADTDAGYFELTHTGNVLRFQKALREAMEACVEGSLELIEKLIEAEHVKVDFDALTQRAIEKFGWEEKVKVEVAGRKTTQRVIPEKYTGVLVNLKTWANDTAQMDDTLAGFVNAITRAAHEKNRTGEYLFNEDEQYAMETYATGLLYR